MGIPSQYATMAILGAALLGGVAHAGSDPTAAAGTVPAPSTPDPGNELPLVLSIRALSLGQSAFPMTPEVERVKAPTGAGSTSWPTGEIAKGVYISVMPACIPGVDEPLGPPGPRRTAPARRR